ncbi:MAG: glycerate kinase [Nitrosopumilaceae archaeon]
MIIKNFASLSRNPGQKIALKILEAGLCAAMPAISLKNVIQKNRLVVNNHVKNLSKYDQIFLVAFGKAADSMTRAVESVIRVTGGVIVVPKGTDSIIKSRKFRVIRSGHPIPNSKSVRAAKEILKFLKERKKNEFIIFLVSGGGSSLLSLPDGLALKDKKIVTELLLKSGADIHEINCVRKHLSQVKGGRLVENLACDAISLVMSDVVDDDLSSIASGTTYFDKTTFRHALNILKRYNLKRYTPKSVLRRLEAGRSDRIPETPKRSIIENYVISNNKDCLDAMVTESRKFGISTKIEYPILGDVKRAANRLVKLIPIKSKSCLVFGGETTVKVSGSGSGGRNQELVLHILTDLQQKSEETIVIASLGTDGKDGNTESAGAIVQNFPFDIKEIHRYLKNNDSNSFFKKKGGLIFTGPTHTNLMDIGIILKL